MNVIESRRRKLFMDMLDRKPGPRRGDYIYTRLKGGGIGTRYLVLRSRQVKRKDSSAVPRYTMDVKIVEAREVKTSRLFSGASKDFELAWYPRTKKKRTFEQYMKRDVPA